MKKLQLLILTILALTTASAQNGIWNKIGPEQLTSQKLSRDSQPTAYMLYALDFDALKQLLQTAPNRTVRSTSNLIIAFPNPEGQLQNFRIYEASVMHPDLAARHPEIKSYVGQGIDDKSAMIRFSVTLFGLHTMTFSGTQGTTYIDPYTTDLHNYIVYNKSELTTNRTHACGVVDNNNLPEDLPEDLLLNRSNNSLFKTYRLAMACTIEYAAFHINAAGLGSGTLAQKKAAVLAAMNVTMTRVNGVYEKDLALTMILVPNNEDIIFVTSDNFDNANTANILLDQSQTEIDAAIGFDNYDIGHTVSTGGGGVATLQSPCSGAKARGITGLPSPVGDAYDIDFVAHEMGHQFGGNHTFNSDQGNCGGGNRTTSSAYEPGSGTTIMAYSGICAPDNVQNNSDDYFHARSLLQMATFINGSGNCGVVVPNGNTPPIVSAGANYTIPFGTAFVLKAIATDVDNDALTYCWEQYNFQISNQPPEALSIVGPNFRSLNPSISPDRYFPKLLNVLANNLTPTWEVIPSVARAMVFSLVVRDNQAPNGGQTQRSTMTLTFANTGPFKVTSQNATVAWPQGSSQNITWDVAGTDANGINTALVNIKLSTDGGLTFPITLISDTPNDGNETITVPNVLSQTCRLMVEAVGNVFYAVNTTPFYIGYQIVTTCNTYTFNTPFALNDGSSNYTVKTINVPAAGVISDVNININATHPNLQNLVMAVIRPGGTLSTLFNQQCLDNADMNVTFDAQGSAFNCASPTQGVYAPPTGFNMNALNSFNQQGNWQFGFKDVVAGNAGTINSITLEICTQTLLADTDFELENFALYPNPNNGSFTVRFDSKSGNKINISVYDLTGRKIYDKRYPNNGLFFQMLQLDSAQSGVYLVVISDGNKKTVKRIVIQ
ncbi:MAG: T9SS type A sorting domain-containing protein [Burkholderiales bacterium]|nr:T9SS type A sorting domain-containing protein [Flavobacterium sp.]